MGGCGGEGGGSAVDGHVFGGLVDGIECDGAGFVGDGAERGDGGFWDGGNFDDEALVVG